MSTARQAFLGAAPNSRKIPYVHILFARAEQLHAAGNLADAKTEYNKILKKNPNHFDAWHMLGLCEHQSGHHEAAVRLLKRALLLDPQSAAAQTGLGMALKALQRYVEATACFDSAIALKPDFADAYYNKANLLMERGRFAEAVAGFDMTISINPDHVPAWNNRGNALLPLGQCEQAIASYDKALTLNPAHLSSLINRGTALLVQLKQAPQAMTDFDRALALAPEHVVAWTNRGEALRVLRRLEDALASCDKALSIRPDHARAWLVRAFIMTDFGLVTEAREACQRALEINPNFSEALTKLGEGLALQGDAEAAVSCFDRSLAIEPDDEIALSKRIFSLDFSASGDFAAHQTARSLWWDRIGAKIAAQHPPRHDNDCDPNRRIVLGYVSADFKRHSAAFAFRPVLESHDKTQFEVICYSNTPTEDAVTDSFRQVADRWRNVLQWSDDRLADCIQADKVDILIDLSGHTDGNRLRAFARKPAPIQVSAWGHPTGTGLPTIDYLFSDPVAIPAEVRPLFAERVYDLPSVVIVEPPPAELRCPEPPVTANGYLTYGVLNRISKITDAAIALWARILRSDVTSRLLIKDKLIDDASVQRMLLERFHLHAIGPERILFEGSTSRDVHLAAHQRVDICLDPFPHGGGVSTWEALYMGVPVVAKLGNGMASRLAGAILSSVGMTDWVAADDDEYVAIALRSTPDRLRTIRNELPGLIERRCSPAEYTRAVEEAYRTMWQIYCGGIQT